MANRAYSDYVSEAIAFERGGCWTDAAEEWAKAGAKARKKENVAWCNARAELCEVRGRKHRPLTAAQARRLTK